MPIAEEQFASRLSGLEAEITYSVFEASTSHAARTELLAASPITFQGLPRDNDSCEVEAIRGLDSVWVGRVRYAATTSTSTPTGPGFRFETRGGTQHITQSLATTRYGDGAPNAGGAIGATGDAVEGTDITVPIYTFSETHSFDDSQVTNAFKNTIFSLTGTVNGLTFRGLNAGECLFLGAAGQQQGDGDWQIDYAFAASPNLTGIAIGDIAGVAKKGWDYLWVRYQTREDADVGLLIRKPIGVYVEQVYHLGDFAALGLGS